MNKEKLIIVDAYAFLFRAFHALPKLYSNSGMPIGAVYGFINIILKQIIDHKIVNLIIACDSGKKNFRHDLYDQYKIHRTAAPEDLIPQFDILVEMLEVFNFKNIKADGYEADDVIATLVKKYKDKFNIIIMSSDKDLMQLIDGDVVMFDPVKSKIIDDNVVVEKFGVPPNKVVDILSLIGDKADNIPGIPGVGEKTALKFMEQFGDLDSILANSEEIKSARMQKLVALHANDALLSRDLIKLHDDIPDFPELDIKDFKIDDFNIKNIKTFLYKYDMLSLFKKLSTVFVSDDEQDDDSQDYHLQDDKSIIRLRDYIVDLSRMAIFLKADKVISISYDSGAIYYIGSKLFNVFLEIFKSIFLNNKILKIIFNVKELLKYINIINYDDISLLGYAMKNHLQSFDEIKNYYHGINGEYSLFIFNLYNQLRSDLAKNKQFFIYHQYEKPLIAVLDSMEKNGILLDNEFLQNLAVNLDKKLDILSDKIYIIAGERFMISSPKQLGNILFEVLKLAKGKKSKTGVYKTDRTVLDALLIGGHEIAALIIEWRHYTKLKNTYIDSLPKFINDDTGRLHTTFLNNSTSTGRLSSVNPNMQNIPVGDGIRNAFKSKEGCIFISADYSQIELRVVACIAKITKLQEAFANGRDIHSYTAHEIFGVPLDNVTQEMRSQAKAINFGIIYGLSAFGLSQQVNISVEEAQIYIKKYFEVYNGLEDYVSSTKEFAFKNGYVETLYGRKCYISNITSNNGHIKAIAERAAINAPIQGTAADILKKVMIELHDDFSNNMLLQIHDELLFEFPDDDNLKEKLSKIKTIMEKNCDKLNLIINFKIGNSYGDMKEYSI
ncbi:MAG: DNA polymerase [Anaplasmataceae bacterium]|nr:DNA polymerase [Anaplasmataceae bacterium]